MKPLSNQEKADFIFRKLQEKADSKGSLMGWFRQWDYNKKGCLTAEEFKRGITAFHFDLNEDVLELVVKKFDLDVNASISFHEFASCLRPTQGFEEVKKWNDKKPHRSTVEKVLIRMWRKLPEDKDMLVQLLETYDDDNTGLMEKTDFYRALKTLNVIKPFEIDTILDSDIYSVGHLFNYKLFLQEASRLGCADQSIDEGRSPRMRVPYNNLKPSLERDREMVRRRSIVEQLSPRYAPRCRNDFSEHVNPFFGHRGVKDEILGPNPDSLQYADESTRFSKTTSYLPSAVERMEKHQRRDDAVFHRINENEQRVFQVSVDESQHREMERQGTLGLYRKQRQWYDENIAIQRRMNRDVSEQGIKVRRGRGPPHFGVHQSGYLHT